MRQLRNIHAVLCVVFLSSCRLGFELGAGDTPEDAETRDGDDSSVADGADAETNVDADLDGALDADLDGGLDAELDADLDAGDADPDATPVDVGTDAGDGGTAVVV